jgi:hypothetical protein
MLAAAIISAGLISSASAAVITGGPVNLSNGAYSFGPNADDQFILSYPSSGFLPILSSAQLARPRLRLCLVSPA